jgi:hypothetical protein
VRRADDAGVNGDRLAAADPLDRPLLQEAQQLHLERERDIAHLVEEERAAMRELDLSFSGFDGPREGSLFGAEQLGSSRFSGIAAQLIATKAPPRRPLDWWSPRASNSLPVPLAPSSITETPALATRSIVRATFIISGAP